MVISIIAVLSALGLSALSSASKGSRDTARKSDLLQYRVALVQAKNDRGIYPWATGIVTGVGPTGAEAPCWNGSGAGVVPEYIKPNCVADMYHGKNSVFGQPLMYTYIANSTSFGMCANLERQNGRFRVTPTTADVELRPPNTNIAANCVPGS